MTDLLKVASLVRSGENSGILTFSRDVTDEELAAVFTAIDIIIQRAQAGLDSSEKIFR